MQRRRLRAQAARRRTAKGPKRRSLEERGVSGSS